MKKIILLFALVFGFNQVNAQVDVIKKQIGETLRGKIKSVDDNVIVFSYDGQNVDYTISKLAVEKITYGKTGQVVVTSNKIVINGEADWQKVIIVEQLDRTAGLEVGPQVATTAELASFQSTNGNSPIVKKLKMNAAKLGYQFVLVTTDANGNRVAHAYKY